MDRLDELLTLLSEGNSQIHWESLNRLEQYLVCILTHSGIEALGTPLNRLEVLLQLLYEVTPENTIAVEVLSARLEEQNNNNK